MAIDNTKIVLGLPQTPQAVPPEMYGEVLRIYNAINNLRKAVSTFCGVDDEQAAYWSQVTPVNTLMLGNLNRVYFQTSESLSYGSIVNVHSSSGTKVQKAVATDITKLAHGICTTPGGVASGGYASVMLFHAFTTAVSGVVAGTQYYLATSAGNLTATPPSSSGQFKQFVGLGVGTDMLAVNIFMQPELIP